jgi:hypothetical protein
MVLPESVASIIRWRKKDEPVKFRMVIVPKKPGWLIF